MLDNFRLNGDVYVSKAGSPGAAGTRDAPLDESEFVNGNHGLHIIGTGTYTFVGTGDGFPNNGSVNYQADGIVKLLGQPGLKTFGFYGCTIRDIYLDQFEKIRWRNNFGGGFEESLILRCVIKLAPSAEINAGLSQYGTHYQDSILFNLNTATAVDRFTRCIFINCKVSTAATVMGCYVDATSSISSTAASNNNVDPACNPGQNQGLNVNGAGFSRNSPGGISQDPGFNARSQEDFTLRATSPHLTAGIGPAHLRYALSWLLRSTAQTSETVTPANTWLESTADGSRVNLLSATNFAMSAGRTLYIAENQSNIFTASYLTDSLVFAANAQELVSLPVISGLNFDTNFPGTEAQFNSNSPEVYNNNVPDAAGYSSGSAGRNPNRLSIKARFSTRQAPRSNVNADWFPSDGSFLLMEIGTRPLWNSATRIGNGDPAFVVAQGTPIVATAMQLEYVATNNYYSR